MDGHVSGVCSFRNRLTIHSTASTRSGGGDCGRFARKIPCADQPVRGSLTRESTPKRMVVVAKIVHITVVSR